MGKYEWKTNIPKPPVDAEVFGEEVERIEAENGGVTPDDVVEAARSANSPLHAAFEWDDREAGDHWRKEQARRLLSGLQMVRVKMADGTTSTGRAFYSVQNPEGRGYVGVEKIMSDVDLKAQVVETARRELERYLAKFRHVAGVAAFLPQLEEVINAMRDEADDLASQAKRRKSTRRTTAEAEVRANA